MLYGIRALFFSFAKGCSLKLLCGFKMKDMRQSAKLAL